MYSQLSLCFRLRILQQIIPTELGPLKGYIFSYYFIFNLLINYPQRRSGNVIRKLIDNTVKWSVIHGIDFFFKKRIEYLITFRDDLLL